MQNSHVFGPFFAIRNDYHIIVNECRSSMVCMHPWFTCSLGLHALCSLLCWAQYVNTQGKYKVSSKLHAELQIAWDYYPRIPHFKEVCFGRWLIFVDSYDVLWSESYPSSEARRKMKTQLQRLQEKKTRWRVKKVKVWTLRKAGKVKVRSFDKSGKEALTMLKSWEKVQ